MLRLFITQDPDDAIAEWVGLHYGLLWDHMTPAAQADYRGRYKLAQEAGK